MGTKRKFSGQNAQIVENQRWGLRPGERRSPFN